MSDFSIGIEEEYMILDPETRELTSHDQKIVEIASKLLDDQVKAEMHQAVVEAGTSICENIKEAKKDICKLRKNIAEIAHSLGFRLGASGSHPFSHFTNQLITPNPRYDQIVNELQEAARSNLIFGLHVHVGVSDRNMAMHIANTMRYFLPHIYALSVNSPFWEGRNTGYMSFRSKVFERFPRTGIPDYFTSYDDYTRYIKLLVKTGCIDNAKKIWWDLRVHPFYPTIEFRVCDIPTRVEATVCIAALFQALVYKLYKLRLKNVTFINYQRAFINENKWRASRYGIDGKLIDFGKEEEVRTRVLIMELLDFVDDVLVELDSREEINYIYTILKEGTGADKQLAVFEKTKSLEAVVDYIIEESVQGLD
jgi:glutamate---cysteine ligase / carboxylate-amine ligase